MVPNYLSLNNNTKYISPKNQTIRKQTSSSNLPTANNSSYTISSYDQNENTLNDEYQDISYKSNKNFIKSSRKISYSYKLNHNKIDEDNEISDENFSAYSNNNSIFDFNIANNTNIDCYNNKANEFKLKYKTEICKFWQVKANCRFGDKVLLYLYIFYSVLSLTEKRKLKKKIFRMLIEQENASNFTNKVFVIMDQDASLRITLTSKYLFSSF